MGMSRHLLLHKAWDDDDELLVEDASSLPLLETAAPCTLSAVKISIISRSIMCLTSTQLLVAGNQQKGPCATRVGHRRGLQLGCARSCNGFV